MSPANRNANKKKRTLPEAAKKYQFPKGKSGNPSGRPKRDAAAEFSLAVLELVDAGADKKAIAKAIAVQLRKGNAKPFAVLAERGYGKAHQKIDVDLSGQIQLVVDL